MKRMISQNKIDILNKFSIKEFAGSLLNTGINYQFSGVSFATINIANNWCFAIGTPDELEPIFKTTTIIEHVSIKEDGYGIITGEDNQQITLQFTVEEAAAINNASILYFGVYYEGKYDPIGFEHLIKLEIRQNNSVIRDYTTTAQDQYSLRSRTAHELQPNVDYTLVFVGTNIGIVEY